MAAVLSKIEDKESLSKLPAAMHRDERGGGNEGTSPAIDFLCPPYRAPVIKRNVPYSSSPAASHLSVRGSRYQIHQQTHLNL